jgi:hypothetical protein
MFGYPDAHNIGSDGYADAISFVTDAYTLGSTAHPDGDSYPDADAVCNADPDSDDNLHAHVHSHTHANADDYSNFQ